MSKLSDDLRSRINPAYAYQLGTESYERRLCAEEIERLEATNQELLEALQSLLNDVGPANSMLGAVQARAAIARATKGEAE